MKFIQGHNRNQINLFTVSLDQSIDPENEVRVNGSKLLVMVNFINGEQKTLPAARRPAAH